MGFVKSSARRVGVVGLLHESNTFLAVPTTRDNFVHASLTTGSAVIKRLAVSSKARTNLGLRLYQ